MLRMCRSQETALQIPQVRGGLPNKNPLCTISSPMIPEQEIEVLREQLKKGKELLNDELPDLRRCRTWAGTTADCLQGMLGSTSHILASFKKASEKYGNWSYINEGLEVRDRGQRNFESLRNSCQAEASRRKRAAIGAIHEQLECVQNVVESLETKLLTNTPLVARAQGNKIFVVHGHDETALFRIERFLKKLQLDPLVLREKPNEGQTIIEKFMALSNQAGFAVVLLTPDDRGGRNAEPYEKQKLRARQNVIFELGFFLGKLGRKNVCALYNEGVEIPSDYQGVLYVKFDESDVWQMNLAKEMKMAGLKVDINLLAQ